MSREERKTDVPENEVNEKMGDFEFSGATSVKKIRQPDGRYTIIAVFTNVHTSQSITQPKATTYSESTDEVNRSAIDILARTLWGEARGETKTGREAIASVVLNRLKRPERFGRTIEEVCLKPFQFSCWNKDDPNFHKLKAVDENDPIFAECVAIAKKSVKGLLVDSVIGADHYHTAGVHPSWSHGKTSCITVENHLFFNNIV